MLVGIKHLALLLTSLVVANCQIQLSEYPSDVPTYVPTESPRPSFEDQRMLPSSVPTMMNNEVKVYKKFIGITLDFAGVDSMDQADFETFNNVTKEWYEGFFQERSGPRNSDRSLDSVGVRDMVTEVAATGQNFNAAENRNVITYDQSLEYFAFPDSLQPEEYILLPFENTMANREYATALAIRIDAFESVASPIALPQINGPDDDDASDGGGGISKGALVGIILGATGFMAFLGLSIVKWRKSMIREQGYQSHAYDSGVRQPVEQDQPSHGSEDLLPDAERRMPDVQVAQPVDTTEYFVRHKDQGRSLPHESQQPVFAAAIPVPDE